MQIIELNEANKAELKKTLEKRSTNHFADIEARVNDIIANVREKKDAALFDYSEKFDHYHLTSDNIRVTDDEINAAVAAVDPEFLRVLQKAAENIRNFHEKQRRLSWIDTQPDGTILGQKFTPLEIVGVYVPGGKAAYPSSLLMSVVKDH